MRAPAKIRSRPAPLCRPPLERMLRIHQAVQSGTHPNATRLARELEVSTKSIHRDIEFMRDRLGLPMEYAAKHAGYVYTEQVEAFPTVKITEGEFVALLVAEKALQQYRGTPFEGPLVSAFKKMASSLPEAITFHLEAWEQTISFHTRVETPLNLEVFASLSKAVAGRQQVRMVYRKPGDANPEPRVIDPYHLANINGEWFLFAYCHLRKDLRTFVPARILKIEPTGRRFRKPGKFSLDQRLRDSFGVHTGRGVYRVVLQFDDRVADYIREKKWHASQRLKELAGGGVELTLELSSLVEIQRWVLGWGGNARVIKPKELAQGVRQAAKRILEAEGPC